jgi:DnaK suppressor protein
MIIQENSCTGLNRLQLEELSKRLLIKRGELDVALSGLNQKILRKQDCSIADAAEAASLREEAARANGIASQHLQTMIEIDQALLRLGNGTYGMSEISGEAIAYERLLLIPWARTGPEE